MSEKSGGEFINFKYPDLQKSDQVQKSVEKKHRIEGLKTPNHPTDRNEVFLDRLENIFNNPNQDTTDRNIELFKNQFLYPAVLIDKNNIPDSYFELQLKIARDRGQGGDLDGIKTAKDIPLETKRQTGETLYNDQKKSLDTWVDYLSSPDVSYPTWFKYYTLRSVTKMGKYNKETHEFSKRSKTSTGIFPDLNREAFSYTYDVLQKHYLKGEKHDNEELKKVLDSAKFDKIYSFAMEKVTPASKENKEKIEGDWAKFDQGSEPTALCESLQGHGTGWCTAGEEIARIQLENGDFYVYYSKNENGLNTIPRIAIRMENNQVAEVRGIDKDQNLEVKMLDIAKEKYHQLPGGEKFDKKDHDMKLLTLIDNKTQKNEELTKEDLCFLYKINSKIEGFGWNSDPRIEEILSKRNNIKDLNLILKGIDTINGDFDLSCLTSAEGLTLPNTINGDLCLQNLTSAEGLTFPDTIDGHLYLLDLTSAKGITFPKTFNGSLDLSHLTSTEGLVLPEIINGDLNLDRLTSAEGLNLPNTISGHLSLHRLTSAEGLVLPEIINDGLNLSHLTSTEGLVLPKIINGGLSLSNLTSVEGLTLPNTIGFYLDLESLTSAEGLTFPDTIDGYLNLSGLTSTKGLNLPETINGYLNLSGLTSTKGLNLPNTINGLYLSNLTSVEGLTLPNIIDGDLYLRNLTSAEGLVLPNIINGDLDLRDLTSAKDLVLPNTIGGYLNLNSLTSAEGLNLPETINGYLNLSGLTSTKGLNLPNTINGLYLRNLTSAEGLVLPNIINGELDLSHLTSTEGLTLPNTINGDLYLYGLASAEKELLRKKYPKLNII